MCYGKCEKHIMKVHFEIQKPFGHNLSTQKCPRTCAVTNNGISKKPFKSCNNNIWLGCIRCSEYAIGLEIKGVKYS